MNEINTAETRIRAAIRRRRIKHIVGWGALFLILIGIIWVFAWYQKKNTAGVPGEVYADIGNQHIALDAELPKPYNSNPPSSGAHFATQANWGIYDYEVNDKIFIHNLEHGGIWVSYRPNVSATVVSELKAIVQEFGGSKLVMAPRSANDADIAVAAWRHVHKFNMENGVLTEENKNQIRSFYKAYKNRGPEFVPDSTPGIDPKAVQ